MHPVAFFDLISFLAPFAALIVLSKYWKRVFRNETKILLIGIFAFSAFYGFCLFLEWAGITKALDKLEDLIGALIPMWWAFVFYALLKEVAEKDLRQSEAKFQDLYDNAPDMFVSVDAKTARIIECNRTLLQATGYEKEEVIGQSIFFLYHPDSLEEAQKAFRMFVTSGIVKDKELQLCRKDGSKVDVSLSVSAVRDERGNILYSRSVWRDITEHKKVEEEIKLVNDRLRYLLRSTSAVIYTSKVFGDYGATFITENVKEAWGYEPKEFIENSSFWIDHVHPDDRAYVLEEVSKIYEKEKHVYEYRFLHKNGSYMWVRDDVTLIKDKSGNPSEIVGYWIDITDRKKAEETLQQREAFLKGVFDGIQDGISVLDKDFNIVRTNMWMEKMYADQLPLPGKKCYAAYQNRKELCPWCPSAKTLETGEVHSSVVPYPSEENPTGWILLSSFPLKNEKGEVDGIIEHVKDITEQTKAEQALRESEEKYRTLFESSTEGVFIMTDVFEDCNEQACKLWACKKEDIVGHSPVEFSPEFQAEGRPSAEAAREMIDKAMSGEPLFFQWKHIRRNGELMDAEVSLKAINVGGRKVLQATMRDITERKKIEEMKDNLIRDVSHSLKTPIAISSMAVDVIKKGIENKDPVTVNTGHSIASNNVKRALKNVNNILDISFFDRKGKARTKQEVSLVDTIKSNLQTFKESIEQKGLEVKLGISKDAETVFFIPSDLMTLFDNLIENAVKFTREGNVSITGENKNGAVEVKIKDTGRGMDAEETKRVFEKFYKKRAAEPGIGLGLSICKEIIERNDAKIEVISEGIGKGTTVTLHLPRMPKQGG